MSRATLVVVLLLGGPALAAAAPDGSPPDGSAGGAVPMAVPVDEITPAQRERINAELSANVARFEADGTLPRVPLAAPVALDWPLRGANGWNDYDFHGISNFVDLDPRYPNYLLDYNCGARTYDLSNGYNHSGTDFFTWPFGFYRMDRNQVQIVAAAPGTIISRADGNFDKNCAIGNSSWNAVYVRHDDGSVAWYGHMKSGSPTTKPLGSRVERGEYLGVVGSSGNSTGPHLHFELYNAQGNLQEPWSGPCNNLNNFSWWAVQKPYYDSAVNAVTTGSAAPQFPACPATEVPNEKTAFQRGDPVYFTTYYHDQLSGQVSQYTIRRPDGSIYYQWTASSSTYYAGSYWYWYYTSFAPTGPDGLWRFEVLYQGKSYAQSFTVGGTPVGRVPGDLGAEAQLMVTRQPGGAVRLDWSRTCQNDETDFAVYEGTAAANFRSHVPAMCSTGGAVTATYTPSAGNRYFLVVARRGGVEGSHGLTDDRRERAVGPSLCGAQSIGACP